MTKSVAESVLEANILISTQERIRAEMNDLADTISTGGCDTIESYKQAVGQIHGLAQAERIILDLLDANKGDEA